MRFYRFDNLPEMSEWVRENIGQMQCKVTTEPGIYSDDHGLTYRPQVILIPHNGNEEISLRWNAFASQPDSSFLGPKARREANRAAVIHACALHGAWTK